MTTTEPSIWYNAVMLLSRTFPALRWVIIFACITVGLLLPRWLLWRRYANRILEPHHAPACSTAIVLGAGLRRDGSPTRVLADRVRTAVSLYQAGKVDTLLMSGSTSQGKDEPAAMRALAVNLGVPEADVLMDPQGNRTYDSCVHAKHVFGIQRALIVTQRFHLPRALILCEKLELDVLGVSADLSPYRQNFIWGLREIPATFRALWDAYVHAVEDDPFVPTSDGMNCG